MLGTGAGGIRPSVQTYRYVVWSEVESYLASGWLMGPPVSEYSCFMFACSCNPEGQTPWTKKPNSTT